MTGGVFGEQAPAEAVSTRCRSSTSRRSSPIWPRPPPTAISGQVFVVYGGMVALMAPPTVEQRFDCRRTTGRGRSAELRRHGRWLLRRPRPGPDVRLHRRPDALVIPTRKRALSVGHPQDSEPTVVVAGDRSQPACCSPRAARRYHPTEFVGAQGARRRDGRRRQRRDHTGRGGGSCRGRPAPVVTAGGAKAAAPAAAVAARAADGGHQRRRRQRRRRRNERRRRRRRHHGGQLRRLQEQHRHHQLDDHARQRRRRQRPGAGAVQVGVSRR